MGALYVQIWPAVSHLIERYFGGRANTALTCCVVREDRSYAYRISSGDCIATHLGFIASIKPISDSKHSFPQYPYSVTKVQVDETWKCHTLLSCLIPAERLLPSRSNFSLTHLMIGAIRSSRKRLWELPLFPLPNWMSPRFGASRTRLFAAPDELVVC